MKKIIAALFIAVLILNAGCTKPKDDDNNNNNNSNDGYMYATFTIDGHTDTYGILPGAEDAITLSTGEKLSAVFMAPSLNRWVLQCFSSHYYDETAAGGSLIGIGFDYAGGVGSASLDESKFTAFAMYKSGSGLPDPSNNVTEYTTSNKERYLNGANNCVSNSLSIANLQVSFSTWANHSGEITNGTFSGILYVTNPDVCQNSVPHPFSGTIHYKMQ